MKHAMDGSPGGAIGLGELAEALTLTAVPQDADAIELEWFAADGSAFKLGAAHAGSPFFGLPRLRIALAGVIGTGVRSGFSRASISVESREMRPIDLSCCVAWMSASCKRWGSSDAANSANARENCDP